MISNNRISNLVNSQVPFFVRNDHGNFVTFLEKYYEYLEQNSKLVNTLKNIQNYQNIDLTEDQFAERLYSTFMRFFPKNIEADKKMLLKHIKDFYRARGTEKSIRFLLSAIHDVQELEFYYPKKDILRASDGKWFIQRSIRIDDIRINGELTETEDPLILEKFIGIKITAQTTGTTALVERVDRFYEETSLIKELIVSNIDGKFKNSEVIKGVYSDGENFREISAVVYNFVIDELKILQQGTFYNIGDPVIIKSNTGNGACVTVGSVTGGEITEITVIDGGSGYQVGDNLKFIGTTFGGAAPARANILSINADNSVHPNTYILDDTQILLAANDIIGNTDTISYEFEPYSYANLATLFETRVPNTSNLIIYSSNTTMLNNYTNRLFRANVKIANNGPIVVNNQYAIISSYNTINDHVTVYPGFNGNVSGYPIETLSVRNWTNLYVNVDVGISSTGNISLLQANNVPIPSNLTIASVGSSNTLTLSAWKANSNVYFTTGTQIVVNGSNLIVTSSSPTRDWIRTTPAITGAIDNTHIIIWQAEYIRANVENSNVFFGVGNTLSINQVNTFITFGDASSNTIDFYPEITIDPLEGLSLYPIRIFTSKSNVGNVRITNAYADTLTLNEFGANSNVFFRAGDYLNVNGSLYFVNSYSTTSNAIVLYPGLQDSNTTFDYFVVNRTPFNATSNLTISTGSSATQNLINLSGVKSTSNVYFETGDSLNVEGTIVRVLSSNTETSTINVYPELSGSLSGATFDVIKKPNVNTIIANSLIYFTYTPTGPVFSVRLIDGGSYLRTPDIQVEGNTKIYRYGILGSMNIADPGYGYTIGDIITFTNVPGGTGTGAIAEVYNVNSSGSITEVRFKEVDGQITGGTGYDVNYLPTANVESMTGANAEIIVKSILGSGAKFQAKSNKVGGIKSLIVRSRGAGYEDAYADLTANGDGNAVVSVSVVSGDIFGVYAYPGRWLGDDGQISSSNYLQNRDYYQIFSYVIKTDTSIDKYRKVVKDLVHPSGATLFGEYMVKDQPANTTCPCDVMTKLSSTIKIKSYDKTGNTINVNYESHPLYVGNTVYLEFLSGGFDNVKNSIYTVTSTPLPDYFTVKQYSPIETIEIIDAGFGYNTNGYISFSDEDGKNANASYTINSTGAIVSININDYGALYTVAPQAYANDYNTVVATFDVTLKYANTTNGNVMVSILS